MYGLGSALSGFTDAIEHNEDRNMRKEEFDMRKEQFSRQMNRENTQAANASVDRETRLGRESEDRQHTISERDFAKKHNDMTRGLDNAIRGWRFSKDASVLGDWATEHLNMGDVQVKNDPNGGYIAWGEDPETGEGWQKQFKSDKELGSTLMMLANPDNYFASLSKKPKVTTVAKDAVAIDDNGSVLYDNSKPTKESGGRGQFSGPPGGDISKYNVQTGESHIYRIIAENKGGRFENGSFSFGGDTEKANQASAMADIASRLHQKAIDGELPWNPASTWANVAIKAGGSLMTAEAAKALAEEEAAEMEPLGPDSMRPGATAKAFGTNEAGDPVSSEAWIENRTKQLLDESYQKTEKVAMSMARKMLESKAPTDGMNSMKNEPKQAKFTQAELKAARTDVNKYKDILKRAGNNEEQISQLVAKNFPNDKTIPEKPVNTPKSADSPTKGFSTPEKRKAEEKNKVDPKQQIEESKQFLEKTSKELRDSMGFTKDGQSNQKKAKVMSDAMVRIRKQLKDKNIENWKDFAKDAETADFYLSKEEKKLIQSLLNSRKK